MNILAIDPGTTQSAYLILNSETKEIIEFAKLDNFDLVRLLYKKKDEVDKIAIEGIVSYGMPIGDDTIQTCYFIGRLYEYLRESFSAKNILVVSRQQIKQCICGRTASVKDGNIRQALIDKYGPQGTQKEKGPLYGIAGDVWSALAIATFIIEWPQQGNEILNLIKD